MVIGRHSTLNGPSHYHCSEGSKIEIGEDCLFAAGVDFETGDGHSIIDANELNRINYAKPIKIGNHVWICSDVEVLKGFEIGNDCVIGAKSVCSSKRFGDNVIIAGHPAKIVKEGINWDKKLLP